RLADIREVMLYDGGGGGGGCACACACACAGGGRAGCARKDFYIKGIEEKIDVKKKEKEEL
ncbi:MAG: hypothetical protein WCS62_07240, partial [Bacilli bacterium]